MDPRHPCRRHRHPKLTSPVSRAQVESELLALYRQAGLGGRPTIAWTAALERTHQNNERRYAQVYPDPARPRFELAPQTVYLPARNRRGLLAHEVGHVLDPHGGEDDADAAAAAGTGVRIGYDKRWIGRGERALKGLQVAKNPGSDDAAARGRERTAAATGDVQARARVLVDRLRRGEVDQHLMAVAAWLGDAAALAVVGRGQVDDLRVHREGLHPRDAASRAMYYMRLSAPLLARISADFAENVLPIFTKDQPRDARPRLAIEAARRWSACPCETHARQVDGAVYAAEEAANEATNYNSTAAAEAAVAAGSVATLNAPEAAAADAQAAAYRAACLQGVGEDRQPPVPCLEADWQVQHMIAVLTGDLPPLQLAQLPPEPEGDVECSSCHMRYWSGAEGAHPTQTFCPSCYIPPRRRHSRRNPFDDDLRRLEREAGMGDPSTLRRLDVARARAGRPFSPPALWHPIVEIPRSWLAWLGPSRRDGEDVDALAYHRTAWPDPRPDGGTRYAWAVLVRGSEDTYVRIEVGINDEDDDPEWIGVAFAEEVRDGAVVRLEPSHGHSGQSGPRSEVMLRIVDGGEEPRLPRPARMNPPPREWKTPPPCDAGATGRQLKRGLEGQRVRVHVNLHNGCFVVGHQGVVAGYARSITLKNVQPRVSHAGWQRCNTEQVRNVHAYLEGDLASLAAAKPGAGWRRITYNCKVAGPAFHYDDGTAFEGAAEVRFTRRPVAGREKIDVFARGRPTRRNPAPCRCRHLGGGCSRGTVQAWWREAPPGCGP